MGKKEARAVEKVLCSGWIGLGPKTEEFEKKFAEYIGIKYAIALNSCTSALHLSLNMLGIRDGDEVITTPITFASTAEAILYNNATPVFADVEENTLNISADSILKKINKNTKAIIIVHYGGQPCDMDKIQKIADDHKIKIIEDAAHACGAEYKGTKIGNSKNITCFSFQAVKNLAVGDGGMITTNNPDLDKRLRVMRWMGIDKSTHQRTATGEYLWDYSIIDGGYKYHMNDIAASIGIVQLEKLDFMNRKREVIAEIYDNFFMGSEIVIPLAILPNRKSSHHIYCVKLKNIQRAALMKYLSEKGISTGVHYKPLYHHLRYAPYWNNDTPMAENLSPNILSLPIHPSMAKSEAKKIAKLILGFVPQSF